MITQTPLITEQMKGAFQREGYFILEDVIPDHDLRELREECQLGIEEEDARLDQDGADTRGITHKGKRYFMASRSSRSPRLRSFLFCPLMAEICAATLGPDSMLFHEQFVVKSARHGTKFGWHQDSGYVGYPHKPYLTCWCALDDMSVENGTVYILPYSRAGTRERVDHTREQKTNDRVGYFGKDPGDPVVVGAGSIAVFSSTAFHRSGANSSAHPRRVYVAQYSVEPIYLEDGKTLRAFADPILKDGKHVKQG